MKKLWAPQVHGTRHCGVCGISSYATAIGIGYDAVGKSVGEFL